MKLTMDSVEELIDLMIKKKVIGLEIDDMGVKIKLTIDPAMHEKSAPEEENKLLKPKEEFTRSDDMDEYEEFLYQPKKQKEAKLRAEINSL